MVWKFDEAKTFYSLNLREPLHSRSCPTFPTDLTLPAPFKFYLASLFSFCPLLSLCSFPLRTGELICPAPASLPLSKPVSSFPPALLQLCCHWLSVLLSYHLLVNLPHSRQRPGNVEEDIWFFPKSPWGLSADFCELVQDPRLAFSVKDWETWPHQAHRLVIKSEFNSQKHSCHIGKSIIDCLRPEPSSECKAVCVFLCLSYFSPSFAFCCCCCLSNSCAQ